MRGGSFGSGFAHGQRPFERGRSDFTCSICFRERFLDVIVGGGGELVVERLQLGLLGDCHCFNWAGSAGERNWRVERILGVLVQTNISEEAEQLIISD
jgi:hypothetical protein